MKDFEVRIWDAVNKEMIVITDFSLANVYKLKEGMTTDEPMIASPYYDIHGERLFEKDVVIPLIKPKGMEDVPWGQIERWPTEQEDFADFKDEAKYLEYYVVSWKNQWELMAQVGSHWGNRMSDSTCKGEFMCNVQYAHENSIKYVKIGTVYTCSDLIENAKKAYESKEKAEKEEKELQCLAKLKAKYEGSEVEA